MGRTKGSKNKQKQQQQPIPALSVDDRVRLLADILVEIVTAESEKK